MSVHLKSSINLVQASDQDQVMRISEETDLEETRPSPFSHILPELLSQIFIFCLPTDHLPRPSAYEVPVLLGRVCGTWRKVAATTPQLWSGIELRLKVSSGKFFTAEAFEDWVSKSGVLPLSISVSFLSRRNSGFQTRASFPPQLSPLIRSMARYIPRCKSIHMQGISGLDGIPGLDAVIKSLSASPKPNLERLAIQYPTVWSTLPPLDLTHFSSLKKLEFDIGKGNESFSALSLPLTRLQRLVLPPGLALSKILQLLRQLPCLEELNIRTYNWEPLPPSDRNILRLDQLKKLTIVYDTNGGAQFDDAATIMFYLFTPALTTCYIDLCRCQQDEHQPDWSILEALLLRCRPPLECIHITNGSRSSIGGVIQCLKRTPLVRELRLSTWEGDMVPLFQALTVSEGDDDSNILCPLLVKLGLVTYVEAPGMFEHSLATMLFSRLSLSRDRILIMDEDSAEEYAIPENYGLREMQLYAINRPRLDFTVDDMERLDVCTKGGLDLRFK